MFSLWAWIIFVVITVRVRADKLDRPEPLLLRWSLFTCSCPNKADHRSALGFAKPTINTRQDKSMTVTDALWETVSCLRVTGSWLC